jgi:uncharacterized protein YcbK (DUF882 family)
MDWSEIRYFAKREFACKCGKCGGVEDMDPDFMRMLDAMRELYGDPMIITSGYRCPEHEAEKKKASPGAHSAGLAADIAAGTGKRRYDLIKAAMEIGMVGVGVANSFIHLDAGHPTADRPVVWKYS